MQTRDEALNDLIEALTISSTYRQRQEQLVKQQVINKCASLGSEEPSNIRKWH